MSEPRVVEVALPTHTAHVLTWGPEDGPLVLALHGFPDTAWTWRYLGPHLAELGFRVAAPFLRGYAPSGIPSDHTYTVGSLMADAVALHAALAGDERAVLVGHDWGAITAGGLGAHPESPFRRIVALAVPPIATMGATSPRGPWLGALVRQPAKSWYIAFNQVPGLAERCFEALARRLWRRWSPGFDAATDLAHLREAVPDRDHAAAVVGYYRAFLRPGRGAAAYRGWARSWDQPPIVPVLFLQGDQDGCLDRRWYDVVGDRLPPGSVTAQIAGTGHFLQVEDPDVVNGHVARFLVGPHT